MSLSETAIRRPVLATVVAILIVVFGVIGFSFLGVREYPAVDPPLITVSTSYRGANPDIVDSQITEPLEQAVNGVPGIRTISSTSREGQSQIRVEFNLDADLETAANDIRDKVSQAVRQLPADADAPVVDKADADSDPIIFMALQSDTRSVLEVSNFADTVIKERVQTIPGVSTVRIFGEKRYAMRVWMDPEKMTALGVTPQDVRQAMEAQNVDLPSGRLEGVVTEMTIQTQGRLTTPEDFNNLIIRREAERQILLKDFGYAELSAENLRSGNKSRGVPMVGIAVVPQPNTNAIAIADEFYKRLKLIERELPPDMNLEIGYDFTRFVRNSVSEVKETLIIAFLLVVGIIFLFLRDWRSTLIPVIAIPVSIIGSFFVMYMAGFTINILTLVGVVLAIGLVCDDAIVVLENVYTKVEQGMSPTEAAYAGSREIYFAVISTTITLAVVFVPIIFLQGLTGRLFREFGVVVVGSVLLSAFIALTLSPMMCRFLLRANQSQGFLYRITEPFFKGLSDLYRWLLRGFIRIRLVVFPILGGITALIIYTGMNLQSELAPMEDRSNIRLNMRAPEGSSYEYTLDQIERLADFVEEKYEPVAHRVFAITGRGDGVNTGFMNIYLKEPDQRSQDAFSIFQELGKDVELFTGLRAFPSMPPTIGSRRGGQPVEFVLQAPNFQAMIDTLPKFLEEANKNPALRFVDSDLKVNRPQVKLEIDRQRAAELGVSVLAIAQTLQLALGDQRFGYFIQDGRQYQVIGQLLREFRNEPDDLKRINVRAGDGRMVSLDNLVKISETISPAAIFRFNRYISATVSGGLAPGYTLGDGIKAMEETAAAVLPEGFSTTLSGQSRDFAESSSSLLFAFVLALLLIYLVLAAQFESFIDPFIILFTVPLSLSGALFSLYYFDQTLNVFSQIGIIMLIGLVTKNGILIVEFANQRKEAGLPIVDAVIDAAVSRFRPILMTSISTILGILPIAMSLGGGSSSRQSLGICVVGGLIIATVLTLFVVPAVYCFFSAAKRHVLTHEELEEHPTSSSDGPDGKIPAGLNPERKLAL